MTGARVTRGRIPTTLLFLTLLLPGCGGGGDVRPAALEEDLPSAQGERIRVEVLNGGGRAGMARLATEELRDRGFDVVYFGNGSPVTVSEVLDRVDRLDQARQVARSLGVETVRSEPDSTRFVDVTVHLGPEWGPAEAPDEGPASPDSTPDGERAPRSGA